jgi:hypothetical protein
MLPLLDAFGFDRIRQHDAGVVDDDVDATEFLHDLGRCALYSLAIGDIDLPHGRLTASLPDGIIQRIELVLPAGE